MALSILINQRQIKDQKTKALKQTWIQESMTKDW